MRCGAGKDCGSRALEPHWTSGGRSEDNGQEELMLSINSLGMPNACRAHRVCEVFAEKVLEKRRAIGVVGG